MNVVTDDALSKLCITLDGWAKKGLTSSYIGTTVHFISKEGTLESPVLDLKLLPSSHTGEVIAKLVKTVLDDWGISKVIPTAVTDNGSNIVKAFKVVQQIYLVEQSDRS